MKRFLTLAIILALSCCCTRLDADSPGKETPELIRILAIGNSFSDDAVEETLWELFHAAGIPVVIGNLSAPGSYLAHQWNRSQSGEHSYRYFKQSRKRAFVQKDVSLLEGVNDEKWDYISLQQASDLSGLYDTYYPYLPDLMAWLGERSEAEIVFHQTWAYPANSTHEAFANYGNDQQTMYEAIMDAVKRVTEECDIRIVIPVGTAVQNARLVLGDKLNRDGLHLELTYGRFLAACVWFETFSGQDVRTNPYRPSSVSEDMAKICREAAHQACLKPYEVTPIK